MADDWPRMQGHQYGSVTVGCRLSFRVFAAPSAVLIAYSGALRAIVCRHLESTGGTATRLHRVFQKKGRHSPWDEPELSDQEHALTVFLGQGLDSPNVRHAIEKEEQSGRRSRAV
jgi:hypothetical protein